MTRYFFPQNVLDGYFFPTICFSSLINHLRDIYKTRPINDFNLPLIKQFIMGLIHRKWTGCSSKFSVTCSTITRKIFFHTLNFSKHPIYYTIIKLLFHQQIEQEKTDNNRRTKEFNCYVVRENENGVSMNKWFINKRYLFVFLFINH